MLPKDIQDFYFKTLDVLLDCGFCPKESESKIKKFKFICELGDVTNDDCKECVSEYIIETTEANKAMIDVILGE